MQCVGVRFFVGKLVEWVYLDAALCRRSMGHGENWSSAESSQGVEMIRRGLGHPLTFCSTVRCIIASSDGMDAPSSVERLLVASNLWKHSIPAEYMPQSGIIMSLLQHQRRENGVMGARASVSANASSVELKPQNSLLAV